MANTYTDIMPRIIASALLSLKKRAVMPQAVNLDYRNEAARKGEQINVPIPVISSTEDVVPSNIPPVPNDTTNATTPILLDQWKKSKPFHLTDYDEARLARGEVFMPQALDAAVNALGDLVNGFLQDFYIDVPGYVGALDTTTAAATAAQATPFTATWAGLTGQTVNPATQAAKVLNVLKAPQSERRFVLDFEAQAAAQELATFHQADQSGSMLTQTEGALGRKFGFDFLADHEVRTHTSGTTSAATVNGAHAANLQQVNGTSVVGIDFTGDMAVGDIIQFAGHTTTYVVKGAVSGGTDVQVTIAPGLQVALAGGEAISFAGSHVANLAFHRDAIVFAQRPVRDEDGDAMAIQVTEPRTQITLRLERIRQYKQTMWELDMLFGGRLLWNELACRVAGAAA